MPEITARGVRFHVQTFDPAGVPPFDPAGEQPFDPARAGVPGPDRPPPGDEPVAVFVHGLVVDNLSSFYYRLAGPVAEAGTRAVLYDQRGHGRSERTPSGYGAADAVADLFGVLDGLGIGRPVHLVANSFGGVVALKAALARPDRVAGLVLIEAHGPAEHAGWSEGLLNTLTLEALSLEYERLPEQFAAIGWRKRSRHAAVADRLTNGTTLLADVAAIEPVRPADLARLRCPVLAVYGEHSDVLAAGRLLRAHVPDCELHVLPGHAHTVLSDGAADLLALMLPWLARHAAPSPASPATGEPPASIATGEPVASAVTGESPSPVATGEPPRPASGAGPREPISAGGAR
ncbi:alpha/beta hydrolase [Spirillospora sp. NPDC049652]